MSTVHPHSMAVATATAQAVEAHLRCEMLDRDGRLLSRYGDQLTSGPAPRALVAPSGRVIASQPVGWLPVARLKLPPGGGQVPLSGGMAVAETARRRGCLPRCAPTRRPPPAAAPPPVLSLTLLGRDGQADCRGARSRCARATRRSSRCCAPPRGLTSEQLAEGSTATAPAARIRVEI